MSCMVVHVCRPTDWQFVVAEMRHVNMNKDVQVSDINVLRDWSSASRDVRENAFDQYYYFRKNTYNSSFANNISEHTHQATLLRLLSCSFSDKSPPFCLFRSFCSSAGLRSSWLPATLFPSVRKLCESPVGGVSTAFQLVSPWPPDTDGALAISSGARPSSLRTDVDSGYCTTSPGGLLRCRWQATRSRPWEAQNYCLPTQCRSASRVRMASALEDCIGLDRVRRDYPGSPFSRQID